MFKRKKTAAFIAAAMRGFLIVLSGCKADKKAQIDTTDGVTNILDYVTVEFSGNNGEDLGDLSELTKYINAVSSISLNIDKNSGLSNGDEVVVTVSYDETAATSAGVVFGEETSRTYEVKGLKK